MTTGTWPDAFDGTGSGAIRVHATSNRVVLVVTYESTSTMPVLPALADFKRAVQFAADKGAWWSPPIPDRPAPVPLPVEAPRAPSFVVAWLAILRGTR